MKLRIRGNTLRLRLSKTEVDDLNKNGEAEEAISFAPGEHSRLVYRAAAIAGGEMTASFAENRIIIGIPKVEIDEWADSELVGIAGSVPIGNGEVLDVLIEKDFACKKPRGGEDETDMFENPGVSDNC